LCFFSDCCEKMKSFAVVAFALVAACVAEEAILLPNQDVTHVVIPKGSNHVLYQWKESKMGYVYGEGCFGYVKVYQKRTNDINPVTDTMYTMFNLSAPIHRMKFTAGNYIAFYVDEAKDDGPDGINGALYLAAATSEEDRDKLLPDTKDEYVSIKIAMNTNTATLTWESTGEDNTTIYRKDIPLKDFDRDTDFPPERYYQSACSAHLWMKFDEDATKNVKIQSPSGKITAVTQVHGVTEKDATIVAITTEFKNIPKPFPRSYKFVILGGASTTVLSTLALLLLLASVLLI